MTNPPVLLVNLSAHLPTCSHMVLHETHEHVVYLQTNCILVPKLIGASWLI
jgi:hypothetical protein